MNRTNFKMQPCQTPGFGLNNVSRTDHKTMKEPGADVCEELNSYLFTLHKSSPTHWYHLINPYLNKTSSCSVTCTSSPCSRPLCCTHPSICGTYLKLSPLNRALSARQTEERLWTEMQFTYLKKKRVTVLWSMLTLYNCRTWFSRNTFVSVYNLSPKGSGYATHKA